MKTVEIDPKNAPTGGTDWARVDALTDEEAEAAARTDPDNPATTEEQTRRWRRVVDVVALRRSLGLTKAEFADRFLLPESLVAAWEAHERIPSPAAQNFLRLVQQDHETVARLLRAG